MAGFRVHFVTQCVWHPGGTALLGERVQMAQSRSDPHLGGLSGIVPGVSNASRPGGLWEDLAVSGAWPIF